MHHTPRLVLCSLLVALMGCSKDSNESSDEAPVSSAPASAPAQAPTTAPAKAPTAAPQPLPTAADVELVTGATDSFQMGCPTDWKLKEPQGKQMSLNCSSDAALCFALEEFGAGELSPADYWKKAVDAQAKMMGPLTIEEEGAFDSDGTPFYRAITPEGIFYAYTNKGRAVTLSCVAMGGDLKSALPTLDAISQSFRWK